MEESHFDKSRLWVAMFLFSIYQFIYLMLWIGYETCRSNQTFSIQILASSNSRFCDAKCSDSNTSSNSNDESARTAASNITKCQSNASATISAICISRDICEPNQHWIKPSKHYRKQYTRFTFKHCRYQRKRMEIRWYIARNNQIEQCVVGSSQIGPEIDN